MKKKRAQRYSSVPKAIAYLRDFGRGYVSVYDAESLRRACQTIVTYIEGLEAYAGDAAKRKAALDAENLISGPQMKLMFADTDNTLERITEHGHET